jgi:ABC-type sugar transport system permease subunit
MTVREAGRSVKRRPTRLQGDGSAGSASRRGKNAVALVKPYLFVTPALALFGLLGVYVVIYGIELSFVQWNGFSPNWTWVGLANYRNVVFADPLVAPVVRSSALTTLDVLVALPAATVLISLPIAFILNSVRRFRALFRTVFFLPYVTAGIAVYYAWELIYQPSGILNSFLRGVGLSRLVVAQGFLGSATTALPAVTAVMVWTGVPLGIVLYMAGLQTIDPDLMDAVWVDGGGRLRALTAVVWPLVRPVTVVVVILEMQQALQNFAIFLLMTDGGPINRTNTLGLEEYNLAFGSGANIGYANALAWLIFVVAAVLAVVMLRFARRSG